MSNLLPRAVRVVERLLEITGGLIIMGLMLLTTVDVIGRYLFNSPVRGAFELTELTLAVLIFAGVPLVSRAQEHIVVDLLEQRMSPAVRAALGRLADLVSALMLVGLARMLWVKAQRISQAGDYTSVLQVPYAPFVVLMAVLVAIAGLVHLAYAIRPPAPRSAELEGNV
jgi:TRAP-type C4-dicarboxylate transport system permease small subunit